MESFCFLEPTGQLGRKSTLKVLLPLWGSSEPPAGPGSSAQELGKPNKRIRVRTASAAAMFPFLDWLGAGRWDHVIRTRVFPQPKGSAVWQFLLMRCTAGTGKRQLSQG